MAEDKELKDQRVVTMMTASELEAIDDWMFKNRIRSRGEAIRRLCQIGLESSHIVEDFERLPGPAETVLDVARKVARTFALASEVPRDADLEGNRPEVAAFREARDVMRQTLDEALEQSTKFEKGLIYLLEAVSRMRSPSAFAKWAELRAEKRRREQKQRDDLLRELDSLPQILL